MLVARAVLRRDTPALHARLEAHDSFYVGTEVFDTFFVQNGLWWVRRQQREPAGFLHGFMTLEPDSEIVYKCTDHYAPECDGAVRWDSCAIAWPLAGITPVISAKDEKAQPFADFASPFTYEEPANA